MHLNFAAVSGSGLPFRWLAGRSGNLLTKEIIMLEMLKKFVRDEEGVTAIEYGLIAALIAVVIITAVTNVGTSLAAVFQEIADALGFTAP